MVVAEVRSEVEIPDGVTVTVKDGVVAVKGKNGELKRTFRHPQITMQVEDGAVTFQSEFARKKVRALVGTWAAHVKNMVKGVQEDYEYALKTVYSHFPIKTKVQGEAFIIENFLGEKTPRRARIMPGVKVKVSGDDVTVTGANVEAVSQTAANIEQATIVRGFDVRVFQDGIYITNKGVES